MRKVYNNFQKTLITLKMRLNCKAEIKAVTGSYSLIHIWRWEKLSFSCQLLTWCFKWKSAVCVLSGFSVSVHSVVFLNRSKCECEIWIIHPASVAICLWLSDPPFIIKGIKTPSSQPQGNKGSCCHRNKLHRKTSESVRAFGRACESLMVREERMGRGSERES